MATVIDPPLQALALPTNRSGAILCPRVVDVVSKEKRSEIMRAVRSRGNKSTEVRLAALFRRYGVTGWRRHYPLVGRPDFVFRTQRVVVFVDGCFWHGCPRHLRKPSSNQIYWDEKLIRNRSRDRAVSKLLRNQGWRVMRLWEHAFENPSRVIKRVTAMLKLPRREKIQWQPGKR